MHLRRLFPHIPTRAHPTAALLLTLAVVAGCGGQPESSPDDHVRAILTRSDPPVLAAGGGDTVRLGPEVVAFYEARDYRAAWTDGTGFLDRGEVVFEAVHASGDDGLDVRAYHRPVLHELVEDVRSADTANRPAGEALARVDILLTEAFLRYARDLSQGTLDPSEEGFAWRVHGGEAPSGELLLAAATGERPIEEVLDSLRPNSPYYARLRQALPRYRSVVEGGGWPPIPADAGLEEGARGSAVTALRARLVLEGDPIEKPLAEGGSPPDLFDADLRRAVEAFQERHGISPDGVVGPATLDALNVPAEERLLAIQLNLDRWRWLPRDLGPDYVLVNVAGFELEVVENRRPALSMNVVVGQDAWQTPIFQDTMEYVVVNPFWNVPESIENDEVLPAVQRDRGYLYRNNFQVVDNGGRVIDPGSVDFHRGDFPYGFRQLPGGSNALGDVKFLFPNDDNIYLHDTPADHLFARDSRAFSHGCIRVERPVELARYVFEKYTDRSPDDYERLRAREGEQWVELTRPLPVYILYFTVWPEEDGSVRFHDDIYRRDEKAAPAVREKLDTVGPPPPRARTEARSGDG